MVKIPLVDEDGEFHGLLTVDQGIMGGCNPTMLELRGKRERISRANATLYFRPDVLFRARLIDRSEGFSWAVICYMCQTVNVRLQVRTKCRLTLLILRSISLE